MLVEMKKVISLCYGSSISEMNKGWLGIYDEGYMHQFQPERTYKIH